MRAGAVRLPMAEDAVRTLLHTVGEEPDRDGLRGTPERVVRALQELTSGYTTDVAALLAVRFAEPCDEMVVCAGIDVVSLCEHHLLPFTGTAVVAYVPNGQVVGLSKLARVVDAYAHRLQVQERLTEQVAEAVWTHVQPKGVGVVLRCRHACLGLRGARHSRATMTTSALRGVMLTKPEARAEFLALAGTAR